MRTSPSERPIKRPLLIVGVIIHAVAFLTAAAAPIVAIAGAIVWLKTAHWPRWSPRELLNLPSSRGSGAVEWLTGWYLDAPLWGACLITGGALSVLGFVLLLKSNAELTPTTD